MTGFVGYCPGCGKRIDRLPPGVVIPSDVFTCPGCGVPYWKHQLHRDGRRARRSRDLQLRRRRIEAEFFS